MKRRLLQEEKGFTLAEVMVTMMIMLVVLFALYSLFDMSLRVFSVGNDKVEAVENARLGLEKMKREIQAAYPNDKTDDSNTPAGKANDYLFFSANGSTSSPPAAMPSSNQITFGNELNNSTQPNGNGKIDCNPSGAPPGAPGYTPCEYITYKLTAANGNSTCTAAPCTLRRVNAANSSIAGNAVVEFVKPNGLQFKYFTGTTCNGTVSVGTEIIPSSPPGSCTQADIATVRITLEISVDRGIEEQPVNQTLTTDVALRNRGEQ